MANPAPHQTETRSTVADQSTESDAERARVEQIIRQALPTLLVDEYGETEAEWRELHSIRRIAAALADRIISPGSTSIEETTRG